MTSRVSVVFDAHAISPHRSGIGEYSLHLSNALVRHCSGDVALHLYADGAIHPVATPDDILAVTANVADRSLYAMGHQLEIPRLLARRRYDVFHSPDFYTSLLPHRTPLVTTIHDVIPLVYARQLRHSLKSRLMPLYRLFLWRLVRRADAIITVSAFSRGEIVRLLGADPRAVAVTLLGPTLARSGAAVPSSVSVRLADRPYLLSVGRRDPYKGLSLMLEAFAKARLDASVAGMALVVTGPDDARYPLAPLIGRLGLDGHVIETGYVDAASLSALYAHAEAFVMPSLYEGFGMPPLDAMMHGTPVICSTRSSLPEVVGDAAVPVDPEQTESFAEALIAVAKDPALRDRLRKKGTEHAALFSWERTARETVKVYREVAE